MQPKIFIIDPLPQLTDALSAMFSGRGWEVSTADSLTQALRTIDTFEPHVVLAGVETPIEVGMAFAQRVRKLHDGNIVLVGMSGFPTGDLKERGHSLFDQICHKPLTDQGAGEIEEIASRRFAGLKLISSDTPKGMP